MFTKQKKKHRVDIRMSACDNCKKILPHLLAIKCKYLSEQRVFCSDFCQCEYEEKLNENALAKLRECGL